MIWYSWFFVSLDWSAGVLSMIFGILGEISDWHRGPDVKLRWPNQQIWVQNNLQIPDFGFLTKRVLFVVVYKSLSAFASGKQFVRKVLVFSFEKLYIFEYPIQDGATELIPSHPRLIHPLYRSRSFDCAAPNHWPWSQSLEAFLRPVPKVPPNHSHNNNKKAGPYGNDLVCSQRSSWWY